MIAWCGAQKGMNYCQTVPLVETMRTVWRKAEVGELGPQTSRRLVRGLLDAFVSLVHVFDVAF